nr:hypothetical protein I308_03611 [Cryptococcus tetragattii IND107]
MGQHRHIAAQEDNNGTSSSLRGCMLEAIRQWPVPFAYIPDEIIRLPTQPPMAYTGLTEGVRKSPIGSAKSMGYWTHYAIDRYLPLPALWSNTFWDEHMIKIYPCLVHVIKTFNGNPHPHDPNITQTLKRRRLACQFSAFAMALDGGLTSHQEVRRRAIARLREPEYSEHYIDRFCQPR